MRVIVTLRSNSRGSETKDSGWVTGKTLVGANPRCRCQYASDSDTYWGDSRHLVQENGKTWDWYTFSGGVPGGKKIYINCP